MKAGSEVILKQVCLTIRKNSIHLCVPYAIENEEELNEDAPKGQDPTHYDPGDRFCEERLLRNLTRDLVCSHWLLNCLYKSRKFSGEKHTHICLKLIFSSIINYDC